MVLNCKNCQTLSSVGLRFYKLGWVATCVLLVQCAAVDSGVGAFAVAG